MEEKKSGRLEKLVSGKGFYIVLALCVLVIGISAWSILDGSPVSNHANEPGISMRQKPSSEGSKDREENANAPEVNDDGIKDTAKDAVDKTESVVVMESGNVWSEPTSWVWPVKGEMEREYTMDALAYDVTMADWRTHDGIDIAADAGETVCAAADGTVESVEKDALYGTTVVISHGNGIKTVYSNLAETPTVEVGDTVKAGDVIGSVGDTAICEIGEPAHIHFAMSKDGKSINPMEYMP
ncbi:MAG: M23 family metallopeptidase [Bacillota bacterium]|nr:M23 family metallopeptidase [Bacillota bacterium]